MGVIIFTANPGAAGIATGAMHCHTTWGRWAVELAQYAGPPEEGMGSPVEELVRP